VARSALSTNRKSSSDSSEAVIEIVDVTYLGPK
jgi:hypothetical protein